MSSGQIVREYEAALSEAKNNPRLAKHVLDYFCELQAQATRHELVGNLALADSIRQVIIRLNQIHKLEMK